MLIMPYDTENKSRNVLASPLGEEGHEVAKGVQANWIHRGAPRPANPVRRHPAKSVCTRVRMIMILDVDVTAERRHYNTHRPLKGKRLTTFCASLRSGSRRLAVRKMIECHISAQPRTPFCHYVAFRPGGKHVTGFSGRFALLQIQFLCHLKGKRENRWHWILCYI